MSRRSQRPRRTRRGETALDVTRATAQAAHRVMALLGTARLALTSRPLKERSAATEPLQRREAVSPSTFTCHHALACSRFQLIDRPSVFHSPRSRSSPPASSRASLDEAIRKVVNLLNSYDNTINMVETIICIYIYIYGIITLSWRE